MSADLEALKQQVVELQSQLAFQEDAISDLDGALAHQQQEVLLLRRQVELLHERLKEQAGDSSGTADNADEKPPHY